MGDSQAAARNPTGGDSLDQQFDEWTRRVTLCSDLRSLLEQSLSTTHRLAVAQLYAERWTAISALRPQLDDALSKRIQTLTSADSPASFAEIAPPCVTKYISAQPDFVRDTASARQALERARQQLWGDVLSHASRVVAVVRTQPDTLTQTGESRGRSIASGGIAALVVVALMVVGLGPWCLVIVGAEIDDARFHLLELFRVPLLILPSIALVLVAALGWRLIISRDESQRR